MLGGTVNMQPPQRMSLAQATTNDHFSDCDSYLVSSERHCTGEVESQPIMLLIDAVVCAHAQADCPSILKRGAPDNTYSTIKSSEPDILMRGLIT